MKALSFTRGHPLQEIQRRGGKISFRLQFAVLQVSKMQFAERLRFKPEVGSPKPLNINPFFSGGRWHV